MVVEFTLTGTRRRPADRQAAALAPGCVRSRREVDVGQQGRTYNMKRQNAPWRKGVPSDAQVREIRRQGIDVDWRR